MNTSALNRGRLPFMLAGALILSAALWAALARIGWALPLSAALAGQHGPLMISGFFAALISLERAVALQRRWAYAAPLICGLGAIGLILGVPGWLSRGLLTAGSLGFVALFAVMFRQRRTIDVAVMMMGVVFLVLGNGVWLLGGPVFRSVPWWISFLVLTIAGERLELAHILRLNRRAVRLFALATGVIAAGLALSLVTFDWGVRATGIGLAALGAWLLRYDIARITIRKTGLTRFIAACLLPGYLWMAAGGALWVVLAPSFLGGPYYDAMLHCFLLGFVFSMVFGHAPIILPSVLGLSVRYSPALYAPLALLHASLALRIVADLALAPAVQRWAGLLNVAAVLVFLGLAAWTARRTARRPATAAPRPGPASPARG